MQKPHLAAGVALTSRSTLTYIIKTVLWSCHLVMAAFQADQRPAHGSAHCSSHWLNSMPTKGCVPSRSFSDQLRFLIPGLVQGRPYSLENLKFQAFFVSVPAISGFSSWALMNSQMITRHVTNRTILNCEIGPGVCWSIIDYRFLFAAMLLCVFNCSEWEGRLRRRSEDGFKARNIQTFWGE